VGIEDKADMHEQAAVDHYEALQISPNADPDMIHRVYRLLAQRYHPDNQETGNAQRFREVAAAYAVLTDPEQRAKYDVRHQSQRQERWRLITEGTKAENDFQIEQATRLTVLEVLYTKRRSEPRAPSLLPVELEELTGRAREHLEFTIWFLVQKGFVQRGDSSGLTITAGGVEYLEQNYERTAGRRLLEAVTGAS
jgi:curved DNA-binding protein CbpA